MRRLLVSVLILLILPSVAYANSSWHWLTGSPMRILPLAVVLTLAVETGIISGFGRVRNIWKAVLCISLANLVSFLAPILVRAAETVPVRGSFALSNAFEGGPLYIVFTGYLVLTIIVELPLVYMLLKKDTEKARNLAASILAANILTTVSVAVVERLTSVGQWLT